MLFVAHYHLLQRAIILQQSDGVRFVHRLDVRQRRDKLAKKSYSDQAILILQNKSRILSDVDTAALWP